MKKEEIVKILDKHLKTLIKDKEYERFKFKEMKTMPEYNAVLNAMLEVAEKVVNKNCNLQNVSNNEVVVCVNCDQEKETHSICSDCLTQIINENKQTDC